MLVRRSGPVLLAVLLAASGCKDVSKRNQSRIVIATFSAATKVIPTPNDFALQAVPTLPDGALKDLLQSFVDQGGFPADQAPTLTVPLQVWDWDDSTHTYGLSTSVAQVNPATITATTAALYKVDVDPVLSIPVEAAVPQVDGAATFVPQKDPITGSRRLAAGRYVFALRGGDSGVKTVDGLPIGTDAAIALTIPNKDLSDSLNQPPGGLSPGEVAQLSQLQALLWNPINWVDADGNWVPDVLHPDPSITPVYAAVTAFPRNEIASIAGFAIAASAGTVPLVDSVSGQAPLPIDLLRTGPDGTIADNPAFGPAAAGLVTLDGFSTTAMILAPTSLPVDASTVNGANVFLFKLTGDGASLVPELKSVLGGASGPARYVAQPTPIIIPQGHAIVPGLTCPSAGGCSPAIGLQPAVPATAPGGPYFFPPLDENSNYAVLITNRVKDIAGRALVRPTIMRLILGENPVALSGHTLLPGVLDDATATALETMRGQLGPAFEAAGGSGAVVLAYTFKTQSFKSTSLQLSAAPYLVEQGAQAAVFTPTALLDVTAGSPSAPGVAKFYDVTFNSVDAIDKTTGALRPTLATDLADAATVATLLTGLHALVAVPSDVSGQPFCAGGAGPRCVPLVVFGHGLNGSKETLYAVASSLAQRGFVAAAIDFPLHGTRNWCSQSSDCVGGTPTCTPFAGAAGQGDQVPPGQCTGGSVPATANSRYFISANFFRIRDTFRQNLLDVGALVLALARPPSSPQPAGNPLATALSGSGIVVNPAKVFYEGLSLGSISGTSVLATNSRMSEGALSVGGGTFADLATNSPAYQPALVPLFTALLSGPLSGRTFSFDMLDPASDSFDLGVAEAFLQTINVAKWILDPGEPVNYAVHVKTAPLPNLLANPNGSVPQSPKAVYGQIAQNDSVILSPFEFLLYALADASQTYYTGAKATHGMLADPTLPVQGHAAAFLADGVTIPTSPFNLP